MKDRSETDKTKQSPPPPGTVKQSRNGVCTEVVRSVYVQDKQLCPHSVPTLFDTCLPDSDGRWRRGLLRLVRHCKCDMGLPTPDAASAIFGRWCDAAHEGAKDFNAADAWGCFSAAWKKAKVGIKDGPVHAAVKRAHHDGRALELPEWVESDPTVSTIAKTLRLLSEDAENGEAFASCRTLADAVGVSPFTAAAAFNLLVSLHAIEITKEHKPNRARRYRWAGEEL